MSNDAVWVLTWQGCEGREVVVGVRPTKKLAKALAQQEVTLPVWPGDPKPDPLKWTDLPGSASVADIQTHSQYEIRKFSLKEKKDGKA